MNNQAGFLQEAKFRCEKCNELTLHERYESKGMEENGRPFTHSGYACKKCGKEKFDKITHDSKW
jgi:uncharacterized protein with PIN domain